MRAMMKLGSWVFIVAPLTLLVLAACDRETRPTAVAALIPDPPAGPVPEPGSYRARWISVYDHNHIAACIPGIYLGSGSLGQRAWVQIDYLGPKATAELVVVDTVDGVSPEPRTVVSETYGAADLQYSDSGRSTLYRDAAPFSRPRQTFVVELLEIDGADGTNALVRLHTFDSEARTFCEVSQGQFYMAALDPKHSGPTTSYGSGDVVPGQDDLYPGPTAPMADTKPLVLLTRSTGKAHSEIQLRFR